MVVYTILILFLGSIWLTALVYLGKELNKKRLAKNNERMVLEDPNTIVDNLIGKLLHLDRSKEELGLIELNKKEIIDTFVQLHDSKVFCQNLSREEVIDFINHKLYKEK